MIKPGDLVRIHNTNGYYWEIYKIISVIAVNENKTPYYFKCALKYLIDDYACCGNVLIDKSKNNKIFDAYHVQIHKLPDHQIELIKEYFLDLFYSDNPDECYIDFDKWSV